MRRPYSFAKIISFLELGYRHVQLLKQHTYMQYFLYTDESRTSKQCSHHSKEKKDLLIKKIHTAFLTVALFDKPFAEQKQS